MRGKKYYYYLGVIGIFITGCATTGSNISGKSSDQIEVELCDGKTKITIAMRQPLSRTEGQAVANELMAKWQKENPQADWVAEEKERHTLIPPHDNSALVGKDKQGHTYGEVTADDVRVWRRETEKFVVAGSRIFHSGSELGSTIAVSCDMCHPHAANTHPETYPKFQVQMGRAVLLRDMINWCIEHPVRGKPLAEDSIEMKALEAYILAQRKGEKLSYGRR